MAILATTVVFVVPFVFVLLTASKTQQDALDLDFSLPTEWALLENVRTVLATNDGQLVRAFWNSTVLTVVAVAIMTVLAAMVGYVVQRRRSRWNPVVDALVLAGLIIRRPSSRRSGCCRASGCSRPWPG